ncbi:glycoside hydrolase family 15 protein [Peristeroidobacter agariperforans]|uniref:glycoside hydrolase family 15 protein n=1 Tax=Peristeroidobacter agariperforans TaxID=268404 RepID=UPI00101C445C|nr:glycoside hydrolase family 15 protein [Peristeroidobacter agariperforans]
MGAAIEDYGMIGDCESVALVGRDGSIDWLCWPRFDSAACFAALLGTPANGRWLLAPAAAIKSTSRKYRAHTLILETRFETADGAVTVIDFMPPRSGHSELVRIVRGDSGQVHMQMDLKLRFDYGLSVPWLTSIGESLLQAIVGPDLIVINGGHPCTQSDGTVTTDFTIRAGETVPFVIMHGPSHLPAPWPISASAALAQTERFWLDWVSQCEYRGPAADAVERSLIVLKALTYASTGGIVAAPTTSLPEEIGGERNWDYRYCWLRDATFTLLAFMNAGYRAEAVAWRDWLMRAVAGEAAQDQIMYGIAGERRLPEWEVAWLSGYEGSRPVRVGNAAVSQLQLDVYGEVADALHQARKMGMRDPEQSAALEREWIEHLEEIWMEPDEGIWEVRSGRQQFTHSKVMAWVAVDRAIKDFEQFNLPGPLDRWRALRAEIHAHVCEHGFNASVGTFVQSYGSTALDASLLLIPLLGFLPAADPRVVATIEAIERKLTVDGLVLRYDLEKSEDGLAGHEGTFILCSFWLVDCLIMLGRRDDAQRLFERLLSLRSDLGLLAEEYDPAARRQLGNFPQAFSHIGLVNSAVNLSRAIGTVTQRTDSEPGQVGA